MYKLLSTCRFVSISTFENVVFDVFFGPFFCESLVKKTHQTFFSYFTP